MFSSLKMSSFTLFGAKLAKKRFHKTKSEPVNGVKDSCEDKYFDIPRGDFIPIIAYDGRPARIIWSYGYIPYARDIFLRGIQYVDDYSLDFSYDIQLWEQAVSFLHDYTRSSKVHMLEYEKLIISASCYIIMKDFWDAYNPEPAVRYDGMVLPGLATEGYYRICDTKKN